MTGPACGCHCFWPGSRRSAAAGPGSAGHGRSAPAAARPEPPEAAVGGQSDEDGSNGQGLAALACVATFSAAGGAILWYGPSSLLRWLLGLVPREPGWEWYVGLGVTTVLSIVMLLPIWPVMCMASGLLFGPYHGCALNFVVIVGAAVVSIALGRCFLREPIRKWLERQDLPHVRRMMLVLEDSDNSLKFQILFRFLFIPMAIRNYGPSTLQIPFWKLCLSTLPHSAWSSVLFATLGASFRDIAELLRDGKELDHSSFKWQHVLLVSVSIGMAVLLAVYAHNKYRERLSQEDEALAFAQSPALREQQGTGIRA